MSCIGMREYAQIDHLTKVRRTMRNVDKQDNLVRAFKALLKEERFGSQGDIVEALKNEALTTSTNPKYRAC